MNTPRIDERQFGQLIRHHLNASTNQLEKPVVDRLFSARQTALALHTAVSGELSLAGIGRHAWTWCEDNLRPFLVAGSLVVAIVSCNYIASVQRSSNLEELDSAVLTDDLPLSAYLDNGFHSWLADSSSQQR